MKLSTKTRYGIRAAIELATHYNSGPLQIRVIAERQGISAKYLEQLMAVLKSAGFIRSVRGARGGYVLERPPDQVKVSEVFNALEGSVVMVECVENENYCGRAADCVARGLWKQVEDAVQQVLQSVTLQDLVDKTKDTAALDYQI
jgi:Rrf2 family cysteine metabolism transcriptional repressor